jgi:hypothetical protein
MIISEGSPLPHCRFPAIPETSRLAVFLVFCKSCKQENRFAAGAGRCFPSKPLTKQPQIRTTGHFFPEIAPR